ncbi:MAG: hypothetical protein IT317_05070 [Anaerolineales bacterium]|nr:hypothetical protein [Anaerolineales bacterium]
MSTQLQTTRPSREGQILFGLLSLVIAGLLVSTVWVRLNPARLPPTPTPPGLAALPSCDVPGLAWTKPGVLLRGGPPSAAALTCLAQAGVDAIVDLRQPAEDAVDEAALAEQAGLAYENVGVPLNTAPSPDALVAWITHIEARLQEDQVVFVHDAGEAGRVGFWDAVYQMRHRLAGAEAVDTRYVGTALPFAGADITCAAGGNGQVQALAEMTGNLSGADTWPTADEHGHPWADCARPAYMADWVYPFSAVTSED